MSLSEETKGGIEVVISANYSITDELERRNARICTNCGDVFIVGRTRNEGRTCPSCGKLQGVYITQREHTLWGIKNSL